MNIHRSTPITIARYGRSRNKTQDFEELSSIRSAEPSQSFSPNLGSPSPPETPNLSHCVSCIGKYLLLEPLEGDHVFRAVHLHSGEELVCKQSFSLLVCTVARMEQPARVLRGAAVWDLTGTLLLAALAIHANQQDLLNRTRVKLESLEDAYILRGDDDSLSDKHGCPAYVSPEILNTSGSYSGKAADVWSLGVMLYTMLVGRYPFHDIEPSSLFSKIRRGQFNIPETLSPKAKCLIRSILRREPSERLTSQEILDHPWFSTDFSVSNSGYGAKEASDQLVPDVNMEENLDPFFN
ncbi:tribbles homolog 2 [Puma concolor]|uniref:Tribbles homolog 2 n=1 Tax=Puma concolor TaxID=9696 RepID=A0A6P6I541_PUMCO|nr:tribbles homolog 2 [Puma concolor]